MGVFSGFITPSPALSLLVMSGGYVPLFLVRQVFEVMKWLMNLIIGLMSQNYNIMVHHVYIKPGGVPNKLCVLLAD